MRYSVRNQSSSSDTRTDVPPKKGEGRMTSERNEKGEKEIRTRENIDDMVRKLTVSIHHSVVPNKVHNYPINRL